VEVQKIDEKVDKLACEMAELKELMAKVLECTTARATK
jgi:hypothetical protein